ncbi:MAG: glucose-6-phosphate isomerase [Pseudomonadota bacterium]
MFNALKSHAASVADRSILGLFDDPDRAHDFAVETQFMRFDYAKTNIDVAARDLLLDMADKAGVAARRDAMFAGDKINETEGRAVLHTALRNLDGGAVMVDGVDVMPGVLDTLAQMEAYATTIRGSAITDVVNIGIGGSDLGPAMAVQALAPYHDGPRCHFVSNVDGAHVADVLSGLDAKTTLVIVASKTFTTIETMTNARTARAWMQDGGGDVSAQFAALSTNLEETADFGIPAERVFGFDDWVGGRYSMWGPIGLSIMMAIGADAFRAFLRGGQEMDRHFQAAEGKDNMPLMLALVGLWHRQGCGYASRAVLPYDRRLGQLPNYFQQLEMESNGKSVAMDGSDVAVETGPIVWGAPGTNGQHAFYQLIHQGTSVVPCEFMVAAQGHEAELRHHHDLLVANCFAQSEALLRGRSLDEARAKVVDKFDGAELERQAAHRVFSGNRPSTTLIYPLLDPFTLGQIVALYEHRVFVEGVILGINSYDQWGVELGKELATALQPVIEGTAEATDKDGSTQALVAYLHAHRG